jgi:hypothetical protein
MYKTCNDTCNVVTYMCCHYVSIIAYIFYSTIVVVVVVMLTSTSSTYPSTTGSFVELATAGARLLPCLCCLGLKDPELENGILAIFIVLNVIVALSQICFELIPIFPPSNKHKDSVACSISAGPSGSSAAEGVASAGNGPTCSSTCT